MKKAFGILLTVMLFGLSIPGLAHSEVQAGISADENGINSFYLAIGEHFQVSIEKVEAAAKRPIPADEIPVAFFIAEHAGVPVWAVFDLRIAGKSWMEISLHFGLTAEVYYFKFDQDPGPPYGKAWGHFKNHKKADWRNIQLSNEDIINLVNLRFVSEHYGYDPSEVVRLRASGDDFVRVNQRVKKAAAEKRQKEAQAKSGKQGKENPGKGNKGKSGKK